MKKSLWISAAVLLTALIAAVIIYVSCNDITPGLPAEDNTTSVSATEQYQNAVNKFESASNLTMKILCDKKISYNNQTFSEQSKKMLHYNNYNTELMTALMEETIHIGNYKIHNTEAFSNGIIYCFIGNGNFMQPIAFDKYISRHAPAVFFNEALYDNITSAKKGKFTEISFSNATAIEAWVNQENCALINASGSAIIDKEGYITQYNYSLTYKKGQASIQQTYTVSFSQPDTYLCIPDTQECVQIQSIDAPVMLEKACGYLIQSKKVNAITNETIICKAFGDNRTQAVQIKMNEENDIFSAMIDIDLHLVNDSREGEVSKKNETTTYHDGQCTITVDGLPSSYGSTISAEDMRNACQQFLIGTILMPEYIDDVVMEETADTYRFSYVPTYQYALTLCRSVCNTLYANPDLLHELASGVSVGNFNAYLVIDKNTGVPVSSGISYDGNYMIDNHEYLLQYTTSQIYDIINNSQPQ